MENNKKKYRYKKKFKRDKSIPEFIITYKTGEKIFSRNL